MSAIVDGRSVPMSAAAARGRRARQALPGPAPAGCRSRGRRCAPSTASRSRSARGETLGAGRRVGLRQDDDRQAVLRLVEPTAGVGALRGRGAGRPRRRPRCAIGAATCRSIFQDPYASLNPRLPRARDRRRAAAQLPRRRHRCDPRRPAAVASAPPGCSRRSACGPRRSTAFRTSSPAASGSGSASRARSRFGPSSSSATSRSRRSTSRCRRR